MRDKLYHKGIRAKVSRTTLARANENRDWRIYCDFAQVLIHQARKLYAEDDFGLELKETVYALDSTTIDLFLSLFPWARFRKTKGAVKMHTLLDLRGNIPSFVAITETVYVLVAIIKKRMNIELSLYTILQIFSVTVFEKIPILQVLTESDYKNEITSGPIQLKLFES